MAFLGIPQVAAAVWTGSVSVASWPIVVAGLAVGAGLVAFARHPHRTLARMSRGQRELTYEIDERGYATHNRADESTRVAWASVSEVIVRPEHLFLVTGAGILPIPRRAFAPHEFDRAVEIARHGVPRAVHRGPLRARSGVIMLVALTGVVLAYAAYQLATGVPQQRTRVPCGLELVVRRTSASTFEADVAFRNDGADDAVGWVEGLRILAYHGERDPVVVVPRWNERLVAVPAHGRSITMTQPATLDVGGEWLFVASYDDSYFDGVERGTPLCGGFAESAEITLDVDLD